MKHNTLLMVNSFKICQRAFVFGSELPVVQLQWNVPNPYVVGILVKSCRLGMFTRCMFYQPYPHVCSSTVTVMHAMLNLISLISSRSNNCTNLELP